ncbi:hypothetical protein JN531_014150 [Flagellatimonas centrodinii]|uniref:hypothetical protein n=1 Tax=Flagellatimonas centrodinii TaxID=2806210 RepID=UPI001FEF0758|nr:hypothetical protein [Flagellatimonas centrodinii]ULQ46236.1 hypothetical protein JN531_014150 [Flagellatimonas centrodinii]
MHESEDQTGVFETRCALCSKTTWFISCPGCEVGYSFASKNDFSRGDKWRCQNCNHEFNAAKARATKISTIPQPLKMTRPGSSKFLSQCKEVLFGAWYVNLIYIVIGYEVFSQRLLLGRGARSITLADSASDFWFGIGIHILFALSIAFISYRVRFGSK